MRVNEILHTSLFIRWIMSAAAWIKSQWKDSRLSRSFLFRKVADILGDKTLKERIMKLLSGSVIFRWIAAAANWIDRQWEKSALSRAFVYDLEKRKPAKSVFRKLFEAMHRLVVKIFKALRLDRALEGSVFKRTFFWCCVAAGLAPIIPTMALLALSLLAFGSLFLSFACDSERKLVYSPVNKWFILYSVCYLVSSFASVTMAESFKLGLLTAVFFGFAVVLINTVRTDKEKKQFIAVLVAAGFAVAIYGIYQYISGEVSTTDWIDEDTFSDLTLRVFSTLDNPNVLAEYLLLIIPLSVSGFFTAKSRSERASYGISFVIMLICMVLTYSRGGYLGLIVSAAVFLVLMDRKFIVLGIIGAACLVFILPESVILRFSSIGDMSDSSTYYRVSIWLGTLKMLGDYWFSGIGPGVSSFQTVYPNYSYSAATSQHAHNLYLQIACEGGFCGIFLFLSLIISFVRLVSSAIAAKKENKNRLHLIAVLSGMAGFLVQGLAEHSFYNYRVMFMFAVIIALGAVLARPGKKEAAEC